ncbi:MAG: secretin N-terminal domain-containing protein [Acidobacteriota bacterium]|jgi:hypothetical protein
MTRKSIWLVAILAMFCFGSISGYAQEVKLGDTVTRLVKVEYVNPEDLAKVLQPFASSGHAIVIASRVLKTLTLSGNADVVDAMEQIVRQLDEEPPAPKAPRDIETIAYLLVASDAAGPDQSMPAQLEPVLKQLRSTFSYKSYKLLDTIVLRSRERESASTSGVVSLLGESTKGVSYGFAYSTAGLEETGDTIRFDKLSLNLNFPAETINSDGKPLPYNDRRGFSTSLDLRMGQMAVVGKSNFEVGNNALITVITAKIVN